MRVKHDALYLGMSALAGLPFGIYDCNT